MRKLFVAAAILFMPGTLFAQTEAVEPRPEDVASPEAIVAAAYGSLARDPGENFDWDRYRSLHLPGAVLIPNTEQTGGEFRVLTVEGFIDWVDGFYAENIPIGSPQDRGFVEGKIHEVRDDYGDVVHIMSTYEKRFADSEQSLDRGVNSFQLVYGDGRWWIASVAWDEENGAGPLPAKYLPE
jgi:hypothetical protein